MLALVPGCGCRCLGQFHSSHGQDGQLHCRQHRMVKSAGLLARLLGLVTAGSLGTSQSLSKTGRKCATHNAGENPIHLKH